MYVHSRRVLSQSSKLGRFLGPKTLREAHRYFYACIVNNLGGSHGIYSKTCRCHVVWFRTVPESIQCRAGADRMTPDPCADRKGGQPGLVKCNEETLQGIDTIKGELLRVENESYFIKRTDGKEAVLHVDRTTQMDGNIRQGDNIEAKIKMNTVDDQKHTVSMRQVK